MKVVFQITKVGKSAYDIFYYVPDNFPDEDIKELILHIVDSSSSVKSERR